MIRRSGCRAILFAILLPLHVAHAQSGVDPAPIVEVAVDPPRVVVGQQATLRLTVLAPNYLTAPPDLPAFQLRNAVTRQLPSMNISEQRDGTTYAGVRFSFAICPQEPGTYATAEQQVHVRYAAEPPATREVEVALPRLRFEAFIPDSGAGLRPFVSADSLSIEQEIKGSSHPLKAGDAVTRMVTIKAEGTPAMLLPPQTFTVIDGLRLYPMQPIVEDKAESRTGALTSTRVDAAIYMVERGGDYSLPAIDVGWWNVRDRRVERIHLAAVPFKVSAGVADLPTTARGPAARRSWREWFDVIADHWLAAVFALIALVTLACVLPGATRWMSALGRHRLAAYRASEAWSFRRFRAAARRQDAEASYFELLGWLRRFEPLKAVGTTDALISAADDPALRQQIDGLRSDLFASETGATRWSHRALARHVALARRKLRRRSRRDDAATALPRELNPSVSSQPDFRNRRVAR